VPSAFGIFFTPWILDRALVWAAAVTAASILTLFLIFRRGAMSGAVLSGFGAFYVVFALVLLLFSL
jgi:cation:H+ antiporter